MPATLSKSGKTLTVDGVKYKVRYAYEHSTEGVKLVCATDKLSGKYGDEFPLADVAGHFSAGAMTATCRGCVEGLASHFDPLYGMLVHHDAVYSTCTSPVRVTYSDLTPNGTMVFVPKDTVTREPFTSLDQAIERYDPFQWIKRNR